MANAIIAYGNMVGDADLSGGSWLAGLPLDNLKDRLQSTPAKSTDVALASTQFDIDLGPEQFCQIIALVNHNFGLKALYRVRTSDTPDFIVSTTDTGWLEVWPAVFNTAELEWEAINYWDGRYTEANRAGYNWTQVVDLGGARSVRYIRVEISDLENTAGYVQIGRVFIAPAWQPVVNMSYGAALSWETATLIDEAIDGTEYFDERTPRRVATFALNAMTEDEAMGRAFEIQRQMGVSNEVLFLWDPDDTVHALRRQFLGRLRTLSKIENPYLARWNTAWEIKELA